MHNEYARCPACTHQARKHDLEGCTVTNCDCAYDMAAASEGTTQPMAMFP